MIHFIKTNVERLAGFAGEHIPAEAQGPIITRAFMHSGQSLFHKVINQFFTIFLGDRFIPSEVHSFLVIIHDNQTADVYVNDIPATIQILAKRDLQAFTIVRHQDIADITELRFPGIEVRPTDCIFYCFQVRWKFGLFFDFRAAHRDMSLDPDDLHKELGACYRYLAFQDIYDTIADTSRFQEIFGDGWFPFLQLLDGDYERIASAYSDITNRDVLVNAVVDTYNQQRIHLFAENWWKKGVFREKKSILLAGIEAYLTMTEAGYITCIKTLYSEIEGIIRLSYFAVNGRDPRFPDLVKYVESKVSQKFTSPDSLAFPGIFYAYLKEVIFRDFNLATGDIELSRHTTSHGVAEAKRYTRNRALQAILTLDQMYFFMGE